MDLLERVLTERTDELVDAVRAETGLTPAEARRLVAAAGDDLVASYRWQAEDPGEETLDSPAVTRRVLGFIRGRDIARRSGLPQQRTWDGIRVLVPAVLQTAARDESDRHRLVLER